MSKEHEKHLSNIATVSNMVAVIAKTARKYSGTTGNNPEAFYNAQGGIIAGKLTNAIAKRANDK